MLHNIIFTDNEKHISMQQLRRRLIPVVEVVLIVKTGQKYRGTSFEGFLYVS